MRTTKRVVATVVGGTTALALAVGSAWATAPTPVSTATVAGGGVSTAGLSVGAAVDSAALVSVSIDLAFRNEAAAEANAIAAATPGSANYDKFLSSSAFAARFGPRPADVAAIRAWVESKGMTVSDYVGDQVLLVQGSAARVAAAFGGTGLRTVTTAGRTGILATKQLTVPANLAPAIAAIGGLSGPAPAVTTDHTPLTQHLTLTSATSGVGTATNPGCATYFGQMKPNLPKPLPFRAKAVSTQECSYFAGARAYEFGANTAKLRKLNFYNGKFQGQGKSVGIVLWGNDPGAARAATTQAAVNGLRGLQPGQYKTVLTRHRISGCQVADSDAAVEQNLDIQAIRTTAPSAKIRYYADTRCVVPDLSLAQAVNENKVQVINNSYGYQNMEYNPRNGSSENYADGTVTHLALVKAANLGITVLFSTGDTGSGKLAGHRSASPSYPATDPFAVAVGGIGFGTGPRGAPAWRSGWEQGFFVRQGDKWKRLNPVQVGGPNAVGSTGGASAYWKAPAWQKRAHVAYEGKRVVPDISNSADGIFDPFLIELAVNGTFQFGTVGGTSVASPLTAGDVADSLVANHRKRAGLITPALYAARKSGAVIDVRFRQDAVGTTTSDGRPFIVGGEVPQENLKSKAGWDNVTGLGAIGPKFAFALRKR